jgi:hypothetical protein
MNRAPRKIAGLLVCVLIALSTPASTAFARTPTAVEWTRVEGPPGEQADRLARTLRALLKEASRKTDFGGARKVSMRARITEYSVERKGDVLRIRCSIIGRLVGGPSAKSRISFGGDPSDPRALEKQVLTMVANGVVSRLAALVRERGLGRRAPKGDPKPQMSTEEAAKKRERSSLDHR